MADQDFSVTVYLQLENHHVNGASEKIENASLQGLVEAVDENVNRNQKLPPVKRMNLKQILQRHRTY